MALPHLSGIRNATGLIKFLLVSITDIPLIVRALELLLNSSSLSSIELNQARRLRADFQRILDADKENWR